MSELYLFSYSTSPRKPPNPVFHAFFSQVNILLFQLLCFFGEPMHQHNLIKHLKKIEDAKLVGSVMYSQFPYFTSDDIRIGPLEIADAKLADPQSIKKTFFSCASFFSKRKA